MVKHYILSPSSSSDINKFDGLFIAAFVVVDLSVTYTDAWFIQQGPMPNARDTKWLLHGHICDLQKI